MTQRYEVVTHLWCAEIVHNNGRKGFSISEARKLADEKREEGKTVVVRPMKGE